LFQAQNIHEKEWTFYASISVAAQVARKWHISDRRDFSRELDNTKESAHCQYKVKHTKLNLSTHGAHCAKHGSSRVAAISQAELFQN